MKIALLTSSRADLGIQMPLIRMLRQDARCSLTVIAFGSHLDPRFGSTISEVRATVSAPLIELPPVLRGDSPADISEAMGRTMEQFSIVWQQHRPDRIIALGDRYEMFAAVSAALPLGIPIAHIHGGEVTLGAIDNALRHSMTHMADLHFTCSDVYRDRVVRMIGHDTGVHNTGALSVDNLREMQLLSVEGVRERFGIDLSSPTVLITYHPETVDLAHAEQHWKEWASAVTTLGGRYAMLVTLPNADTGGLWLRERWRELVRDLPNATAVDSLGALGYLSCMKHTAFLLGNSSSGYVEASFLQKPVIDVGERQTGRLVTPNIVRCPIQAQAILSAVELIEQAPPVSHPSPYGDGHSAERMMALLVP